MRWLRTPDTVTEQQATMIYRDCNGRSAEIRWRVYLAGGGRWAIALDCGGYTNVVATGPNLGYAKRRADQGAFHLGHMSKSEAKRFERRWGRECLATP